MLLRSLIKCIWNLRLQKHYQDDENFALWLRMLSALAFVPSNDIIRYFGLLIDEIRNNFNDECDDVIGYFEDAYIGICFIKFIRWYTDPVCKGAMESCDPPPYCLSPRFYTIFCKKLFNFVYICFPRAAEMRL